MRRLFEFSPVVWLLWTWALLVLHMGVLRAPEVQLQDTDQAQFYSKKDWGVNQLVVSGEAYGRGLRAGQATSSLLRAQEQDLTAQLFRMIPQWLFKILEVPLIRFFYGIEKFSDPWMLQEMFGVAQSAPREYDFLVDRFTRQFAYHGLHEVGQMMVDQGGDMMGCTVVAMPFGRSWVLGRNFDFEGGAILDREKLVKWVFPTKGYAYVSIIWAGMVGGVTAVNEHGLYMSINAAGSEDRRRLGMPSTLLLVKVMMEAKSADEAIKLLKATPMFITDIFVLLDAQSGRLYRIEKSPRVTEVIELKGPSVVTNHLLAPHFAADPVNLFRMHELTSIARQKRGEELLAALAPAHSAHDLEQPILRVLRDKGEDLPLGNRQSIDPMIATHSVVYNSDDQILFVSSGPALVGEFIGFDLRASFKARHPVRTYSLPADSRLSTAVYESVKASLVQVERAGDLLKKGDCAKAQTELEGVTYPQSDAYFRVKGDVLARCLNDSRQAEEFWRKALEKKPAYARERLALERRLAGRFK